MLATSDLDAIAAELLAAYDERATVEPLSTRYPHLDVAAAYDVLFRVEAERRAQGWRSVGWKIGFTNRTLWPRYGVWQPMWASVWDRTLHDAPSGTCTLDASQYVRPRIEPEVVFGIGSPLPPTDDARVVLASTEWIAPGFEIVQSHFPDWKFTAADCTAAFGLHGALVLGPRLRLDDDARARLVDALPATEVILRRDGVVVDRGLGVNVLDSPALSLAHLSRMLAEQRAPALDRGDIVTTGTITDAWPVGPGETWTSTYGDLLTDGLGIDGITVRIA